MQPSARLADRALRRNCGAPTSWDLRSTEAKLGTKLVSGSVTMTIREFAVFEYLYRDVGNFKAWGRLRLVGSPRVVYVETIKRALRSGEEFIAEQVGVPPLYKRLWSTCGTSRDPDVDHAWHEFFDLRAATHGECAQLEVHGALKTLIKAFASVECWREELSRNWR